MSGGTVVVAAVGGGTLSGYGDTVACSRCGRSFPAMAPAHTCVPRYTCSRCGRTTEGGLAHTCVVTAHLTGGRVQGSDY